MLLKFRSTSSLLALALILGLSTAPAAYAEGTGQAGAPQQIPQDQPQAMNPADVTDEHLDKFANVNVKAREIQDKYLKEVDGAKTMDDIERIQQKMNSELVDAIHAEDLSVEEFQQVNAAVQQDPVLQKRVIGKINERTRQAPN